MLFKNSKKKLKFEEDSYAGLLQSQEYQEKSKKKDKIQESQEKMEVFE